MSGQLHRRRKSRRQQSISSYCRRIRMWPDEYKTWSLCCSRCIQRSWLSRVMTRMTLSPTRGRTRCKHGDDCRNDMIRRQEEENETFCERSFLLYGALFWNFKRRWNAGNPTCRATRRSWKDKLDDEIKLAVLEAVEPEELEKHLKLNSNRLRTFEDARLEIVTYVEAKFGSRIRNSKPHEIAWTL